MKTNDLSEVATPSLDAPVDPRHAPAFAALRRQLNQSPYKRKRLFFILAVSCQLLILTGLASVKAYTLAAGTTVTLRTVPVDPRDIFRGDYVALNFEISSVQSRQDFKTGEEVYVILRKGNPYWAAEEIRSKPGQLRPSEVAIKAKIDYVDWRDKSNDSHTYRIHYGVEQAFVPEGTGRKLETEKHLSVQVAVDQFGNSVLKNVRPE